MEDITKEWSANFLVPIDEAELSDPNIIGISLVTWVNNVEQSSMKKNMKKEEMQSIETDEEESAL